MADTIIPILKPLLFPSDGAAVSKRGFYLFSRGTNGKPKNVHRDADNVLLELIRYR
jgi:hypothetical protein